MAKRRRAKAKQRVVAVDRRSDYSPELANEICERIANGETLRAICVDKRMPDKSTVLRWAAKHDDFTHMYGLAMRLRADVYADEMIDIADNEQGDPRRDALRLNARQWVCGKAFPRKYGDAPSMKLALEYPVEGPDGTRQSIEIHFVAPDPRMQTEDLEFRNGTYSPRGRAVQ